MPRTPSIGQVSSLSRDDWESLCSSIFALVYGAHRVEDRRGRGNGLDAWRRRGSVVYGWQFRRFDARLGASQVAKVKENMRTAARWSLSELKLPLSRFTLVFNIDPQPGHGGSPSEIAYLEGLVQWARVELGLSFAWRDMSWVRAQLLRHPQLRPELFEDLAGSIEGSEARLSAKLDFIEAQLTDLAQHSTHSGPLATLISEASLHYERGRDYGEAEELRHAARSLEDALRLIDGHAGQVTGGVLLRARVLTLLSGVEGSVGQFARAIEHGRRAVEATENAEDTLLRVYALGNFAAALSRSNGPNEARPLLEQALAKAEELGDVIEIIRTRTFLLEVDDALDDREALRSGVDELARILSNFHAVHAPTPITTAATAQCANAMLSLSDNEPTSLKQALAIFASVERMAIGSQSHLVLATRAQQARCLWFLNDLESAKRLYASVEQEALDEYPGLSADACFNLALIIDESGDRTGAMLCMRRARDRYGELGNLDEVRNVDKHLRRLEST